jgi:hypothetical protein
VIYEVKEITLYFRSTPTSSWSAASMSASSILAAAPTSAGSPSAVSTDSIFAVASSQLSVFGCQLKSASVPVISDDSLVKNFI